MALPGHVKYLVIGAGIHGLSTAYHLALGLQARGSGNGADIAVVDKSAIAAGASGIACGVVRNNYYQPAMRELMAACVEMWESDPDAYNYHSVGYMQISPESMHAEVAEIAAQQRTIGYESEFIEGEADCRRYMRRLFGDWQAPGITSILHEKKGGYAHNRASIQGLADKARSAGVSIHTGVEVTGFGFGANSKAVTTVETNQGAIGVDQVVVGAGPWVPRIWDMLDLPDRIDMKGLNGALHRDIAMWRFWCLQEGTLGVEPSFGLADDGSMPPVIHVDSDEPLYSDVDGRLITDKMWGIYYKPDFNFGGVPGRRRSLQGGDTRARRGDRPLRAGVARIRRRRRVQGDVVLGARLLPGSLSGPDRALARRAFGRDRRVYRRQLPGVRPLPRELLRDRRFEPRLQDDRRRQAGCGRAIGPRERPARAVPLLALCGGPPAPGLQQPLPMELTGSRRPPGRKCP